MRNAADTEVPIMPPTLEKAEKWEEMADAEVATTRDVIITMLRVGWIRLRHRDSFVAWQLIVCAPSDIKGTV